MQESDIAWTGDDDVVERFEEKYEIDEETGCWNWTAWVKDDGYGRFAMSRGVHPYAHRLGYRIYVGEIPDGLQINHHCDNRRCVNPGHLYAGTQQENMEDALERTFPEERFGEESPSAKLKAYDVLAMRAQYATGEYTHRDLADVYGISHNAVREALKGETWGHIEVLVHE